MRFLCFIFVMLSLVSCGTRGGESFHVGAADTLRLSYAENISIVQTSRYTIASLRNPWDTTKILHTYILVPKEDTMPAHLPQGTVIRTPVSKALVYSSVHCNLLSMLNAEKSIGGICDFNYILLPFIREGCGSGAIVNCGNSMNPDIEKIIELHPDLIMLSPYENSGSYGQIAKLEIPVLECADYMETSMLGRAEWIKFYGIVFGREHDADSIFSFVEKQYNALKDSVKQVVTTRPSMFTGMRYGTSWYMSGGKSTVSKLYADAGFDYVFAERKGRGADALSFESVFDRAGEADFWFITYNQAEEKTYGSIKKEYEPYSRFAAFKNRHIFACNTAKTMFFEDTTFRPDLLLREFIVVSHPEILPNTRLHYFSPLAE